MIYITMYYHKTDMHQNKDVPAGQWIPAVAGMTSFFILIFLVLKMFDFCGIICVESTWMWVRVLQNPSSTVRFASLSI